jgi:hypothetical protein
VKRAVMAIAGALGLGALWRRRRREKLAELPAAAEPDPAEELRAKLIESKAAATGEEAPAGEPVAADGNGTPIDPEVRRRAVHERARASIDDLSD